MATKESEFARLVTTHRRAIIRYGLRRMADNSAVEDLVAETFIVAWRKWEQLPKREEELFWLYGIAGRVLSNLRRREVRQLRLQGRLSLERATEHESPLSPDDVARLLIALGQLAPHEREILELLYWEKLSYREIALALGCSENAVGVRLTRARKSLRTRIDSSLASISHLDQKSKEGGS
jgi:RNA polymerase sigma-70 factor (ECF subfamily)